MVALVRRSVFITVITIVVIHPVGGNRPPAQRSENTVNDYSGWYSINAKPADAPQAVATLLPAEDSKAMPPPLSEEDKEAAAVETDLASKGFPYQAGSQ